MTFDNLFSIRHIRPEQVNVIFMKTIFFHFLTYYRMIDRVKTFTYIERANLNHRSFYITNHQQPYVVLYVCCAVHGMQIDHL